MISDDHGRDDLGCYGNPVVQTPNLDRLAAEGIRFGQAFCTTSSCSPSRSVILTGLHNHANGMYGLQREFHHFSSLDHISSLPVMLAGAGYRTARMIRTADFPSETGRLPILSATVPKDIPGSIRSGMTHERSLSRLTSPITRTAGLNWPSITSPFPAWTRVSGSCFRFSKMPAHTTTQSSFISPIMESPSRAPRPRFTNRACGCPASFALPGRRDEASSRMP